MCGIAGFLGRYPSSVAEQMRHCLRHRGPDGEGSFLDRESGVAIVHRRLSIIDLSDAGHQPMTDASGRFTIGFNGEIYNYRELRQDLLRQGAQLQGHSDTEVVLELFAREGCNVFRRLNGIFAIAVWDAHARELTLARDGMGVKPLYLHSSPRGLSFASELKALFAIPDLDRTLDTVAAVANLSFLWSPGERTMLRSVRKMAPGTWMKVDSSGERASGRFYSLPDYAPDRTTSVATMTARTAEHIRTAVERQMVADVEVGAFLSGGLDSSALVAFAREHAGTRPLQCFTIDYTGADDEANELVADLPYARRVAEHLGVDLHTVSVGPSAIAQLERLIYTLDEPAADPAAINALCIAAMSRQLGIKVLLSGAGGDDIFTGYRRHKAAHHDRLIEAVPGALRRGAAALAHHLPTSKSGTRRIRKFLDAAALGSGRRLSSYFEWLSPEAAQGLLAIGDPHDADAARQPILDVLAAAGDANAVERMLRVEQNFFLTDHNLNYTDKTGMAEGVEIRVPFLDPDLMAFAATIPTDLKMRHGWTKWIFRKAMEPYLPRDVIYRPKTGFGVPLRSWLRGPLRPMLDEMTSESVLRNRGLFRPEAVAQLKRRTLDNSMDGSYTLFGVVAMELWCRKFIDSGMHDDAAGREQETAWEAAGAAAQTSR